MIKKSLYYNEEENFMYDNEEENFIEEEQINKFRINNNKKVFIIGIGIFIAVYLSMSLFFWNHFYFSSKINGIDVSCKTVDQAEEKIGLSTSMYTLEVQERGGIKEKINGKDIQLAYNPEDKVKNFKKNQNPLLWIKSLFSKSYYESDVLMTFDDELLKVNLNKLKLLSSKDIIEPKDASFEYTNQGYKIINEVEGNKINKDKLYKKVESAISKYTKEIDLDVENCYEVPKYTSNAKEVIHAKDLLNKYISSKIIYLFGATKEGIDGTTINKWLDVDKEMNVVFNEKKIRRYVDLLAGKYNTFGNTRSFATSSLKTVQVSGGNYGWIINKSKEVNELIENIKKGEETRKEPAYLQTALSHGSNDIGNTYVEINMTQQHLWFYKKGILITDGDIVTGSLNDKFGTPAGTYRLAYKERKATLKGSNYSTKVDFWMPFNGGIGIHDAIWRSEFGKNIYILSGSHGCINSPYDLAKKIFDNIEAGTPVICYTE